MDQMQETPPSAFRKRNAESRRGEACLARKNKKPDWVSGIRGQGSGIRHYVIAGSEPQSGFSAVCIKKGSGFACPFWEILTGKKYYFLPNNQSSSFLAARYLVV
jgi:hypothetical protein